MPKKGFDFEPLREAFQSFGRRAGNGVSDRQRRDRDNDDENHGALTDKDRELETNASTTSSGASNAVDVVPAPRDAGDGGTAARLSPPHWTSGGSASPAGNIMNHWNKHGGDFPECNNALEYAAQTQEFLRTPPATAFTGVRSNGDVVVYDPVSDVFGIMDANGAPRTMYIPNGHSHPTNLEYFNAQF